MLELWDELLNLHRERQLCADDLEMVKAACPKKHQKSHVIYCLECWDRFLNRMRDRYLNPATREWFTGRRLFLQELDTMFSDGRRDSPDFKILEQRISDEKKEWYRDKVKSMGLHTATRSPTEAKSIQQKLNDPNIAIEVLALELREAISDDALLNETAFDDFLNRLKDAKSPHERNEVYVDVFFQPRHDPQNAAKYQKYIDMVRKGSPINDVVNIMLRDRRAFQGEQDEKQRLQRKLEELKRAKAAHELSLAKKQKARQDKAAAAAAAASDGQYRLPPCSVCSSALDAQNFLACPLCQLLNEQYGPKDEPALYCSQRCHDDGYVCPVL